VKRTIIIGAICALLGGAGVAGAQTTQLVPSIFGSSGKHYVFDAKCHRVTFVPPGISTREAVNVGGQQVWCLVRRPDPFAQCVKKLGPAPTVAKGHTHPDGTSDWSNVDKVAAYLAAVSGCSRATL